MSIIFETPLNNGDVRREKMRCECPYCNNFKRVLKLDVLWVYDFGHISTIYGSAKLSWLETEVFQCLIERMRPQSVLNLLEYVYSERCYERSENNIAVAISKINKKIKPLGLKIVALGRQPSNYILTQNRDVEGWNVKK